MDFKRKDIENINYLSCKIYSTFNDNKTFDKSNIINKNVIKNLHLLFIY